MIVEIEDDPSILGSKPINIQPGLQPNRLVLRRLSDKEYVIHRENLELLNGKFVHKEFYWGHYFDSFDKAKNAFMMWDYNG